MGVKGAKEAVLDYALLEKKERLSLVEVRLYTGWSHQIRVQTANIGCPIVGDRTYGNAERDRRMRRRPSRQLLHAVELSFLHPVTHRRVTFAAPPPDDIVYA